MKIILKPHLKIRLKGRLIPSNYPSKVLSQPDNQYYDTSTDHLIAVKKLQYQEKLRPMVVAYDIIEKAIEVVTIYPTDEQEIKNRIKNRRWIKYEKN